MFNINEMQDIIGYITRMMSTQGQIIILKEESLSGLIVNSQD